MRLDDEVRTAPAGLCRHRDCVDQRSRPAPVKATRLSAFTRPVFVCPPLVIEVKTVLEEITRPRRMNLRGLFGRLKDRHSSRRLRLFAASAPKLGFGMNLGTFVREDGRTACVRWCAGLCSDDFGADLTP